MRIEIVPMIVNACCTVYYLLIGDELGKIIYWAGATMLTVGLYKMRG